MIASRVSWIDFPVDKSMTVSAPHCTAQVIFSTSSAIKESTTELPILAFIFTKTLRDDGSSIWLGTTGNFIFVSLRRHYPDQVRGVAPASRYDWPGASQPEGYPGFRSRKHSGPQRNCNREYCLQRRRPRSAEGS